MTNQELRNKYWDYISEKTWKCNKCGKENHRLGNHMDKHAQIHEGTYKPEPLSDEELLQKIIKGKQTSRYTYKQMAVKFGISKEKVQELYAPYVRNTELSESQIKRYEESKTDISVIKERIRRYKLSCIPYWQMSEKLNMPQEEVIELGKEFPWAKPSHPRHEKGTTTKQPKTLSVKVLSRYMKEEELKTFLQNYKNNTTSGKGISRETILQQPLLKEDLEILKNYVTVFDAKLIDVAKERGITLHALYTKVLRLAVRVVAQNPSVLDRYFKKAPKEAPLD